MMDAAGQVPTGARIAELWAKFKAELDTRLDEGNTAADEEVAEMLNEVFGTSGGGPPTAVPDIAANNYTFINQKPANKKSSPKKSLTRKK